MSLPGAATNSLNDVGVGPKPGFDLLDRNADQPIHSYRRINGLEPPAQLVLVASIKIVENYDSLYLFKGELTQPTTGFDS